MTVSSCVFWELHCCLVALLTGALEGEDPAGARWFVVEEVEAVCEPAEGQRGLLWADEEFRLVDYTTELQTRCLNVLLLVDATMSLNTQLSVQHRTS